MQVVFFCLQTILTVYNIVLYSLLYLALQIAIALQKMAYSPKKKCRYFSLKTIQPVFNTFYMQKLLFLKCELDFLVKFPIYGATT